MSPVLLAVCAGVLWVFPLWIFRAKGARLGSFDQRAWPRGRNLALSVVDVVRAAVGANLMLRGVAGLPVPAGAPDWMPHVWVSLALGVALVVQSLAWRDEDHVLTPVGFLLGAVLVLIQPVVLIIGLPLAIGAALAIRAWSAGLIGAGLGIAGVGLMVESQDWRLSLMLGAVINLPVVTSVMVGRHMGGPRK